MVRVKQGLHSFTCHPHVYPQVEWAIPAFTLQPQSIITLWLVLIFHPAEGRRLSWTEWLVTNRGFTRLQAVTHPGTNWDRRRVTSLIETNTLPLSQVTNQCQAATCVVWQWFVRLESTLWVSLNASTLLVGWQEELLQLICWEAGVRLPALIDFCHSFLSLKSYSFECHIFAFYQVAQQVHSFPTPQFYHVLMIRVSAHAPTTG